MTLQNRVLPTGEIIAASARGMFMGNRGGVLHDSARQLGAARWRSRAWIICQLEFNDRKRVVMAPNRYTELFFLDEAVALSAGHRPCAQCQRARHNAFRGAFRGAFGAAHGPIKTASEMDAVLHGARITRQRQHITHRASADGLPDGCFINHEGASHLVRGAQILRYTPNGYTTRAPRPSGQVIVLTPAPTVATLAHGYRPTLHESAAP